MHPEGTATDMGKLDELGLYSKLDNVYYRLLGGVLVFHEDIFDVIKTPGAGESTFVTR